MNKYWSQAQDFENNQRPITSSSALDSVVKVIETLDTPPNITSVSEPTFVLPEAQTDTSYLLPQKVKVRRFMLRK